MLESIHGPESVHPTSEFLSHRKDGRYQTMTELCDVEHDLPPHRFLFGHFIAASRDLLTRKYRMATLMRDPVDRSISIIRLHAHATGQRVSKLIENGTFLSSHVADFQTRVFGSKINGDLVRPQESPPATDETLRQALLQIARFDFVGMTEMYQESVDLFDKRFGTSLGGNIERINAAPAGDVGKDDLVPIVEPLVQRDMELYTYAKSISGLN